MIGAKEEQVQKIIDYFTGWLPQVNRVYEERVRREEKEAEEKERKDLERQIAEQEARQRILKNVKLTK